MKNIKIRLTFILSAIILCSVTDCVFAQEYDIPPKYMHGEVLGIEDQGETKILITSGEEKGREVRLEEKDKELKNVNEYEVGDKVLVSQTTNEENKKTYQIVDYIRTRSLGVLFILFVVLATLVGSKKGFFSLISMAISFLIIFIFLLPQIQQGKDPILIAIISSMFIIPVTFYISHGFNEKATIAIVGTVIALIITGILSVIFSDFTKLTGSTSEEILRLQGASDVTYNLKGLLLAGILIGTLGIMDDITVAQAGIVYQLHDLKNDISISELFRRSLQLGRDHIASMINTLVLVYTGASMPLLLLFMNESRTFSDVISLEIVATEIVKTLVGSIGLILAVPITTGLACYFAKRTKVSKLAKQ